MCVCVCVCVCVKHTLIRILKVILGNFSCLFCLEYILMYWSNFENLILRLNLRSAYI